MLATALLARGFPPQQSDHDYHHRPLNSKPDVCLITSIDAMNLRSPNTPGNSLRESGGARRAQLLRPPAPHSWMTISLIQSFVGFSNKVGGVREASELFLHSLGKNC